MGDLQAFFEKLIIAISGMGAGGYAIARLLKRDLMTDTLNEKSKTIIDNLERQIDSERTANRHLHEVIERIAKERNEAVKNVGRMEGHIQALETQVSMMREEIQQLETSNSGLTSELMGMRADMSKMAEVIAKIGVVQQ